jgi:hypothetical protein
MYIQEMRHNKFNINGTVVLSSKSVAPNSVGLRPPAKLFERIFLMKQKARSENYGEAISLGAFCSPRADPDETDWRNSGDVTRNAPHAGRQIVGLLPQIESSHLMLTVRART